MDAERVERRWHVTVQTTPSQGWGLGLDCPCARACALAHSPFCTPFPPSLSLYFFLIFIYDM